MAAPPVVAAKAAQKASSAASGALTHDLYVRSWDSVKNLPKSKGGPRTVHHELHVNPVTIAVGGAGLLGGLALLGLGAYMVGVRAKVDTDHKLVQRIIDEYQPTMKLVTVVDVPAIPEVPAKPEVSHWEVQTRYIEKPGGIKVPVTDEYLVIDQYAQPAVPGVPAVTHQENVVDKAAYVIVMSNRFRPTGKYATYDEAVDKMQARYKNPRELTETRLVWVSVNGRQVLRHFVHFKADGATIGFDQGEQRGALMSNSASLFG